MELNKTSQQKIKLSLLATAMVFALSACDGDDGTNGRDGVDGAPGQDGSPGQDGAPGFAAATFLVANNGDDNRNTVTAIDQNASALSTVTTGANEGIVFTQSGALVQAGDSDLPLVRSFCGFDAQSNYMMNRGHELTGAATGLVNPKGIAFAEEAGLIMVADFNGQKISVFGGQAAGDVAPIAEIMTSAKPWDLAYDEESDRLYVALTDGTLAVYDDVASSDFAPSVMRSVVPSDADGNQLSINLHGIVYEPMSNRIVLSDVGDAAVADDGQIFVLDNVSTADGATVPTRVIGGATTQLGNPVDIILTGSDLRVAEKSNDAILVFSNIFNGESGDVAPTLSTPSVKPESLDEFTELETMVDASDDGITTTPIRGLSVSSNPSTDSDTTGQVAQYSAVLSSELSTFDSGMSIESAAYTASGDGVITFDNPDTSTGGLIVVNRLKTMRDGMMYSDSYDHMIVGSETGLIAPKGLDISSDNGMVFVADVNETTPAVRVFSPCASGNVAPLLTLEAANGARPWDVDYDPSTDSAYLALTNGTVAVFEEVVRKMESGQTVITGEDRLIVPASGGTAFAAPTNIHGIDYDSQSDSLVISDVGSAADATDGKLYVISGAGSADGLANVSVNIAGPNSMLGNPVDLMLSNGHVYVAEKSNGMILRFDNILNASSGDIDPTFSMMYPAPESVQVLPVK
ncbi:NHL repeat containing protein [Alteromonas mediterranea]|uniref:NHL repeat containing protein n=1 Tax=Alteromonas mediterranea TaxID=314275 RepID=UPI0003557375|nr:NHL repeat containing protein [Alteromonas mediterranea]AGP85004.1 NHL repeat containing protein [Alteromonas mediterranea U4]AGP89135.1 NHL repeat containing protein [Alteromonas mediterranea U7]AGP93008.1 NHL repeat containing protein [Alteromonas mediterranea U8]